MGNIHLLTAAKNKATMAQIARIIIILILLASAFGLSGCATGSPLPPLSVELSFPHGAPYLNQIAELRCLMEAHDITDNLTLKINLSNGFELVSGDLAWSGNLSRQSIRELKANIRAIKVGNWTIQAVINVGPQNTWFIAEGGGIFNIYVSVAENSAQWGEYPPWTPPPPPNPPGYRPSPPSISPYSVPTLLSPANGATGWSANETTFLWTPFKETTKYKFIMATDAAMIHLVKDAEVTTTSYEYNGKLDYNTIYFWRVMALEPAPSDWSATFIFKTETAPLPSGDPPP